MTHSAAAISTHRVLGTRVSMFFGHTCLARAVHPPLPDSRIRLVFAPWRCCIFFQLMRHTGRVYTVNIAGDCPLAPNA